MKTPRSTEEAEYLRNEFEAWFVLQYPEYDTELLRRSKKGYVNQYVDRNWRGFCAGRDTTQCEYYNVDEFNAVMQENRILKKAISNSLDLIAKKKFLSIFGVLCATLDANES